MRCSGDYNRNSTAGFRTLQPARVLARPRLKAHLQNLEDSEEIKVEHVDKGPANGKPSTFLYPTAKGNKTLENIKKRKKTEKE